MLVVKLRFGLDLRRWCLDSEDELNLERIEAQVRALFPVGDSFLVQFTDDEGELVTLASSADVEEALRVCRAEGRRSLRLEVTPVDPVSRSRIGPGSESDWGVASVPEIHNASPATASGAATGPCEGTDDLLGFTFVPSAWGQANEGKPDTQSASSTAAAGAAEPEPEREPAQSAEPVPEPKREPAQEAEPEPEPESAPAPAADDSAPAAGGDAASRIASSLRALSGADPSSPAASTAFDDLLSALLEGEDAPLAGLRGHPLLDQVRAKDSGLRQTAIECLVAPGTAQTVEQFLPFLAQAPFCGEGATGADIERALSALAMFIPALGGLHAGAGAESAESGEASPAYDEGAEGDGSDAIHTNVSCDACGMHPIMGVRYKCSVCRDYDLCPACEASEAHSAANHPMLKIVDPSQAPAMIITALRDDSPRAGSCRGHHGIHGRHGRRGRHGRHAHPHPHSHRWGPHRRGGPRGGGPAVARFLEHALSMLAGGAQPASRGGATEEHFERDARGSFASTPKDTREGAASGAAEDGAVAAPASGSPQHGHRFVNMQEPAAPDASPVPAPPSPVSSGDAAAGRAAHAARPRARFMSEAGVMDGTPVAPGQRYSKSWTMANTGDVPWAQGTRLVHVGGDRLGAPASVLVPEAAPGAPVDIELELEAPQTPGRYVSYWRLTTPEGSRFGHRVWIDVRVEQPSEGAVEPVPSAPAVDADAEAGVAEGGAEEAVEEAVEPAPAPAAEPAVPDGSPLAHLLQMGWPREQCERTLRDNNNDLQAAVLALLE